MIVHQLTERKDTLYTAGCGYQERSVSGSMPESFTGWWTDVSCPLCALRVIVHMKVEDLVTAMRLIDDPKYTHHRFHFTGKRYGFMWLEPTPLIYVYNNVSDENAMCATHIKEHCGPLTDTPATKEMAQQAARDWIIMHSERFGDDGGMARTSTVRRPSAPKKPAAPVVPPGYDGPLCAGCGKIDEGDFMPSEKFPGKDTCMVCLLGGKA